MTFKQGIELLLAADMGLGIVGLTVIWVVDHRRRNN